MSQNLDIPYLPSSFDRVITMVELAEIKKGQKTADLGSGDGRVVIACAKLGAQAHGYELSEERVELARKNIKHEGLEEQAVIHYQSFWDENFADFDTITLYGITSIMDRLEDKLLKELKPGTKVISNVFVFPNWKPVEVKENVYLYLKS